MRPHIWPGLALAGGVVIAAVVVLLALGGGGGSGQGSLPPGTGPGDTRLFPSSGRVAARIGPGSPGKGAPHAQQTPAPSGAGGLTSDAAANQYDAQGTRGPVLGGP